MLTMFNHSKKSNSTSSDVTLKEPTKKSKESSSHAGGSKKSVHRILPEDGMFYMELYNEATRPNTPSNSRP